MGAQCIIGDTKGFRRWTLIRILMTAATGSVGIALIVLAPMTMSPPVARDVGILFAVVSVPMLAYLVNSYKKTPRVYAYYLGISGGHKPRVWYSAFGYSYYWFNDAGIWENRALVAPWGEVYDVGLIEVWEQFVNRMAVRHGRVRVILKDGRNFVVEDVVEPDEVLNFMRDKYWRQGT